MVKCFELYSVQNSSELKTTVSEGSDQSAALENEIGGDARDSCRIVAEVPSSPQKPNQEHEEEKQVDSDESAVRCFIQ